MEYLAGFILVFLTLRTLISLVNLFSGLHLPDGKPESFPKVSVLIPARNEEKNVGKLLTALQQQDYPELEVIVCNDHSTDRTEEILGGFTGEDSRFRWFIGEKLPPEWLGKNFACHQLAQKASGEIFLFLDADVELNPDAIRKAVTFFQQKKLALLSVFPQQKMQSLAEWATVPAMNWILQSLLPMILVQKTPFASLSAANGQFMLFDAKDYRKFRWHERVKNENVEDILIARLVKTSDLKMAVLLGNREIYCRMYNRFDDAVIGFSRNIHQYFGGSTLVMSSFWFIVCFGPFIVFAADKWCFFFLFVPLSIVNRVAVAWKCRQNIIGAVILHPLQMIGFTAIVLYNLFGRIKRETEWKGRKIQLYK
jgi:glycosyltransferase involved in cell wall biosynthesis